MSNASFYCAALADIIRHWQTGCYGWLAIYVCMHLMKPSCRNTIASSRLLAIITVPLQHRHVYNQHMAIVAVLSNGYTCVLHSLKANFMK